MSLERLVVCTCGHAIDTHGALGCMEAKRGRRCLCPNSREGVVDNLITLEREAIRRQWTRDEVRPA